MRGIANRKQYIQSQINDGATIEQLCDDMECDYDEMVAFIITRGIKRKGICSPRNPLNQMARDYLASISDLNRLIFNKAW